MTNKYEARKEQALQAIKKANGRIFFAEFVKKNGDVRRMTARLGVSKGVKGVGRSFDPASKGLLGVYDMDKNQFRMINVNTLRKVSVDGKTFAL